MSAAEGRSHPSSPDPEPDDRLRRSYQWMMTRRSFTADELAREVGLTRTEAQHTLTSLLAVRLVRAVPDAPRTYGAVSPDIAAAEATGPIEAEIDQLQLRAARVRASLRTFQLTYLGARLHGLPGGALETLESPEDVEGALVSAMRNCGEEVFTVEPDPPLGGPAEPIHALGRELVERHVRVRSLHTHAARAHRVAHACLTRLVRSGAEVRTTRYILRRMTVFDRSIAFIPDPEAGLGVTIVRHPTVVSVLCDWMEDAWDTGAPFEPADMGYAVALDDMQQAILDMLSNGLKDEIIARRLRISLRTCRRHIADLMVRLDANSRFQAGVNAVRLRDWL